MTRSHPLLRGFLPAIAVWLFGISLSVPVWAHGGQYAGPSTSQPPKPQPPSPGSYGGPTDTGGGGRGPVTHGPRTPSGPTPAGGATPAPSAGTRGARGVTSGFYDVSQDLSRWERWWELNQHALLDLRASLYTQGPSTGSESAAAIDRMRPGEAELRERVLPKLLFLVKQERQPDLQTGAIMALAKIGLDTRLCSELATSIADPNQEVAETATLGLGLLGDPRALPALLSLARDDAQGRSFVAKTSVPMRTRAFAIYACGLFGEKTADLAARARIVDSLRSIDADSYEIQAARVIALGIVRDPERRAAEELRRLLGDRKADARVRAMAPISLARLLGGTQSVTDSGWTQSPWLAPSREALLRVLEDAQEAHLLRLSCIQALPHFAQAAEATFVSKAQSALLRIFLESKSGEEKQLAAIALGKMGGTEAEDALCKQLARTGTLKPWAALGLGLLARGNAERQTELGAKIVTAFENERNPSTAGALAVAMGLAGDRRSAELLRSRLESSANEELRGYVALSLGMIGAREALPQIAKIAQEAVRRPELQKQSVIALGLLGDRAVGLDLVARLAGARTLAAQASLAAAIGWIGDRRSLDALLELLDGSKLTPLSRAFVAAALGMIGDTRETHWSATISSDLNYFAAPSTLLDPMGLNGLLDIL